MEVKRVAILGAGNGGITAAADLKSRGFEVALYELPKFGRNLEQIKRKSEIQLVTTEDSVYVKPDLLTTDIAVAVKNAQIVMLTVPSFAIEEFARLCAPVIEDHQIVLINNAACMGSVRFENAARKSGETKKFKIGELNTLAYGTRAYPAEAKVELSLRVQLLYFAALPAKDTPRLIGPCKQLYDSIVPAVNVWETTLTNGNPEVHPGPCLLNAGRIEYSKGEFWLYKEGITPHVVNIITQVQNERLALGRALGLELDDARKARVKRGYLKESSVSLNMLFNTSPVFSQIKGPLSIEGRYMTEDISNGLVLFQALERDWVYLRRHQTRSSH